MCFCSSVAEPTGLAATGMQKDALSLSHAIVSPENSDHMFEDLEAGGEARSSGHLMAPIPPSLLKKPVQLVR